MRTITTFSLLLFFAIDLAAQVFGPLGTKWTYSQYYCFVPPCKCIPFYLYANEEEVYNGKLCRKITASGPSTLPDPCYIYNQNDTVYFYSHITQQFEFLYDFDAHPGDIWEIKGLPGSDNGNTHPVCTIVIDSVTTIQDINGNPLKVWHFTNTPSFYDWYGTIIEGFGASCFLMPSWGLYEQQICGARCIESPGVFHQLVDYDCDEIVLISGTTDVSDASDQPAIYPVPAQSNLTISWKTTAEERPLYIYDVAGRLMEHRTLQKTSTCDVDISRYLPGIYLIKSGKGMARFMVE